MKRKFFLLLSPDAADGGQTQTDDGSQTTDASKPAAPAPAAPPAGTVVANAPSERERELAAELERARNETVEERKQRLEREKTICELQDKHENYRKSVEKPAPKPAKKSEWVPLIGRD